MVIGGKKYLPLGEFMDKSGFSCPSDVANSFKKLAVSNLTRSTEDDALYALVTKDGVKHLAKYKESYSRYNANIMLYPPEM